MFYLVQCVYINLQKVFFFNSASNVDQSHPYIYTCLAYKYLHQARQAFRCLSGCWFGHKCLTSLQREGNHTFLMGLAAATSARFAAFAALVVRLPMSQPQPRRTLTIFGVTAAVRGTRTKMKDLWMAYARANWVPRPVRVSMIAYGIVL